MGPRLRPIPLQGLCVWTPPPAHPIWLQASAPVYYGRAFHANEFLGYTGFVFVRQFIVRGESTCGRIRATLEKFESGGVTCRTLVNSSAACEEAVLRGKLQANCRCQ